MTTHGTTRKIGPNEKDLTIQKFTRNAIPVGGDITDGLRAIVDPDMPAKMKVAAEWVQEALDTLMATGVYKNREEAAQVVLDKI